MNDIYIMEQNVGSFWKGDKVNELMEKMAEAAGG
jgi:hypothetical protein